MPIFGANLRGSWYAPAQFWFLNQPEDKETQFTLVPIPKKTRQYIILIWLWSPLRACAYLLGCEKRLFFWLWPSGWLLGIRLAPHQFHIVPLCTSCAQIPILIPSDSPGHCTWLPGICAWKWGINVPCQPFTIIPEAWILMPTSQIWNVEKNIIERL